MKIPGRKLVGKAEETANVVGIPMTRGLGLVDLLKKTSKEAWKDHLDVFAGNLTYKLLFALFPFSVFLLSLLNLFGAQSSSIPSSTGHTSCCRKGLVPF